MEVATRWQCDKRLCQSLYEGLNQNILSDVTFLVGEEGERVEAHKFILVCRSPTFYAQLLGPLAERGPIRVTDIDVDSFREFIRYLYSDHVDLTHENVTSIHYCSRKYCVDTLASLCAQFMKDQINLENVCVILEECHTYSMKDLKATCMDYIQRNTDDVIHTDGFLSLCTTCLNDILLCDTLTVTEVTLYERVLVWSENQCSNKNLRHTDANRRFVLEKVIRNIRFPIMNEHYFKTNIANRDLLKPEEVIDVFLEQFNKTPIISSIQTTFNFKTRNLQRVKRYRRTLRDEIISDQQDAISFQCSIKMCLHGVSVYTPKDDYFDQVVNVQLENEENELIMQTESKEFSKTDDKMYDVVFPSSVELIPNKKYTLCVIPKYFMRGFHGTRGRGLVNVRGSGGAVTFMDARDEFEDNTTSVFAGQIPGLLLSWH